MKKELLVLILAASLVSPTIALSQVNEIDTLDEYKRYVSKLVKIQVPNNLDIISQDSFKKIMEDTELPLFEISKDTLENQRNEFTESAIKSGFTDIKEEDERYTYSNNTGNSIIIESDKYSDTSTCTYGKIDKKFTIAFSDVGCDGTIESAFYSDDSSFYLQCQGITEETIVRIGDTLQNSEEIKIN